MSVQRRTAPAPSEAEVITKAVLRAADRLGLPNKVLANVLGLSEATISRMRNGAYLLQRGQKPFELAALLVRLYRSLDAIVGGDAAGARAWLGHANPDLAERPLTQMQANHGRMQVTGDRKGGG